MAIPIRYSASSPLARLYGSHRRAWRVRCTAAWHSCLAQLPGAAASGRSAPDASTGLVLRHPGLVRSGGQAGGALCKPGRTQPPHSHRLPGARHAASGRVQTPSQQPRLQVGLFALKKRQPGRERSLCPGTSLEEPGRRRLQTGVGPLRGPVVHLGDPARVPKPAPGCRVAMGKTIFLSISLPSLCLPVPAGPSQLGVCAGRAGGTAPAWVPGSRSLSVDTVTVCFPIIAIQGCDRA